MVWVINETEKTEIQLFLLENQLLESLMHGYLCYNQPYVFKVGAPAGKERKREFVDNPNGLFSAQAAPKPPQAMYSIAEGMKVGGKVIHPPFLVHISFLKPGNLYLNC